MLVRLGIRRVFAVSGGVACIGFGFGVGYVAQAKSDDRTHGVSWVGSGPTYYGGYWARALFSDVIEKNEKRVDPTKLRMVELTTQLQYKIIQKLEKMERRAWADDGKDGDPALFRVDVDDRRDKGKVGITACIQGGRVVEKAGVGVTMLSKALNPRMAKQMSANHPDLKKAIESGGPIDELEMWVNGISCIVHPVNPKAPTVHFNYRHFQISRKDGEVVAWWFGGGQDLTPIYLYEEDAKFVHNRLKAACDKHNRAYYPKFKAWADKYFYHTARKEARGIGGIFFDDLDDGGSKEQLFTFVKDCADTFVPSYFPILEERKDEPYGQGEKDWQALRHGRYVEFNLVYDRGTKFGFSVPGVNIEAVLMSLPLTVRYMYKHVPEAGSAEAILLDTLTGEPKEWASDTTPVAVD